MLDSTGVLNLGWNDTVRTKIKAVVSLSGPAKLCDWQNPGGIPQSELTQFEMDLDNYVGLPQSPPDQDCSVLDPASPYTIVSTATSSPPVMLYACQGDPVPYEQATQMHDALIGKFPSLEVDLFVMDYGVMDQTNHAYKYWHALNTLTGNCVSSEVIAFLQSYP